MNAPLQHQGRSVRSGDGRQRPRTLGGAPGQARRRQGSGRARHRNGGRTLGRSARAHCSTRQCERSAATYRTGHAPARARGRARGPSSGTSEMRSRKGSTRCCLAGAAGRRARGNTDPPQGGAARCRKILNDTGNPDGPGSYTPAAIGLVAARALEGHLAQLADIEATLASIGRQLVRHEPEREPGPSRLVLDGPQVRRRARPVGQSVPVPLFRRPRRGNPT